MTCPICAKDSAQRYHPFCSRRCSDVDLGRWLTGSYVVPAREGEEGIAPDTAAENPPRPQ